MNKPATIVYTALTLIVAVALAGAANAQTSGSTSQPPTAFSMGVRPQLIDATGPPGARKTFDLFVRNFDARRPCRLWLWLADPIQQLNGAVTFGDVGTYEYSCSRWLTLSTDQLSLLPGEEKRVRLTITVPGGRTAGSFHSVIVVSGSPPKTVNIAPSGENEVFSYTRVAFGVIFHFAITGTLKPNAKIESMFVTKDPPPRSGLTPDTAKHKQYLVLGLRNTGNSMIYGWGWAMLRKKDGGLVGRWRVGRKEYGEKSVVYPGRRVDLYLPIDRPAPKGEYIAKARLQYSKYKAALGELGLTVTEEDAKAGFKSEAGPFKSLTLGLSVTFDREFQAVSAAPGGYRTGVLTVQNNEDSYLLLNLEVSDAVMDPDGVVTPVALEAGAGLGVADWLKAGPAEFQLPPNGKRRISYGIGLPKDTTQTRDLLGLIQVRAHQLNAVARKAEEEVIGEAGALLLCSIAGKGKRDAEVGVLKVDVRPELAGTIRLGVPVKNSGDIHFFPLTRLNLQGVTTPSFQTELMGGQDPDERMLVLSGMERIVWFDLRSTELKAGRYLATVTVDYGAPAPLTKGFTVDLQDYAAATDKKDPKGPAGAGGEPPKQ